MDTTSTYLRLDIAWIAADRFLENVTRDVKLFRVYRFSILVAAHSFCGSRGKYQLHQAKFCVGGKDIEVSQDGKRDLTAGPVRQSQRRDMADAFIKLVRAENGVLAELYSAD